MFSFSFCLLFVWIFAPTTSFSSSLCPTHYDIFSQEWRPKWILWKFGIAKTSCGRDEAGSLKRVARLIKGSCVWAYQTAGETQPTSLTFTRKIRDNQSPRLVPCLLTVGQCGTGCALKHNICIPSILRPPLSAAEDKQLCREEKTHCCHNETTLEILCMVFCPNLA